METPGLPALQKEIGKKLHHQLIRGGLVTRGMWRVRRAGSIQDLFLFERMGISPTGKVLGRFRATGIRPKISERLATAGIHLPPSMFEQIQYVE